MKSTIVFLLIIAFSAISIAQQKHSAYAGEEKRTIKSLSVAEIKSLKEGEGIGMAKAAELNHYPGPKHILDLADVLKITDEQKSSLQQLYKTIHENAVRVGNTIIKNESELDSLFANNVITAETLKAKTDEIGRLLGELRRIHLGAYLSAKNMLTEEQLAKYDKVHGYSSEKEKVGKKMKEHKKKQ